MTLGIVRNLDAANRAELLVTLGIVTFGIVPSIPNVIRRSLMSAPSPKCLKTGMSPTQLHLGSDPKCTLGIVTSPPAPPSPAAIPNVAAWVRRGRHPAPFGVGDPATARPLNRYGT